MELKELDFQNRAISDLYGAMAVEGKRDVVFKAPTGSGKTVMLTKFMDAYMKGHDKTVFVWLTPGQGELEVQSKAKMESVCPGASTKDLADVMTGGFAAGDAVFINWQKLNRDGNNALKDSERTSFIEWIDKAFAEGLSFKVVIDESHNSFTDKSDAIVEWFRTDKIIRASATPTAVPDAIEVEVSEDDVIAEGLIKKRICINPGFPQQMTFSGGDLDKAQTEYLLERAMAMRETLRVKYNARAGEGAVNPLVLVQMPNNSDELLKTVETWFAARQIDVEGGTLAVWLANDNRNTEGLKANDGRQVAVILKQALATGWDCPRAQILVKLRKNMDEVFEIQTVGRVRRMPEACHYGDDELDSCYIYTFDETFKAGVVNGMGAKDLKTTRLFLKNEAKSFELTTEQRTMVPYQRDELAALKAVAAYFRSRYHLTGDFARNRRKLEAAGYVMGSQIEGRALSGNATKLKDMARRGGFNDISYLFLADTHRDGHDFQQAVGIIGAECQMKYDPTRVIVNRLFGVIPDTENRIANFALRDLYAFVINNVDRLKDDFLAANAANGGTVRELPKISEKLFRIPHEWTCVYDGRASNQKTSVKNVYKNYPMSAVTVKTRSTGEVKFEKWCERAADWFYRNGDKGDEYFSIVYEDNAGHQRLFYPDYILSVGGGVWIIEVKGNFNASGGSENIDIYAPKKAAALKAYCTKHGIRGGFACYDEGQDELLFNEERFSEDKSDRGWKLIEEVVSA